MNTARLLRRMLCCLALALPAAAHAAPWLVTPEEARASAAAPPTFEPKPAPTPDAPRIELLAPNLSGPVPSVTRIRMRFEPVAPAVIRPDTFRVRYGALRLDITQRIVAAATVAREGIDVAEAKLPSGSHRLFVEISDSLGRVAERVLQFTVE